MAFEGRIGSPRTKTNFADPLFLVMGASLSAAILWLYWPVLVNLFTFLYSKPDYSHALILPLVSGYIIYLIWPQLRHLPLRPTWFGLALMIIGLALYLVCLLRLGESKFLVHSSFLVLLIGILLLIFGWKFVWRLKFPLFLLALTFPPPSVFSYRLSFHLQIISSRFAGELLQLLGYAVNRQGNVIELAHAQVQVVAACSGLGNLLTLLSLGCIFCYFYQRRAWKVAILLAFLLPTAVMANAFRVTAMAIFPALTAGFWHGFSSWLTFLLSFGFLMLINRILNLFEPPNPQDRAALPSQGTENHPGPEGKPPLTRYLAAALVVVLLGVGVLRHSLVFAAVPLRRSFQQFPLQLGPWQGRHQPIDPEMSKATGSDAHLSMEYQNSEGKQAALWIAYYEKESYDAFRHTPRYCMTGNGWDILKEEIREIAPGCPVVSMVMQSLGDRVLVFYWHLWHGQWVTENDFSEPYLIWDSLYRHRTDGAMIRLITPISGDQQEAAEILTEFARLLLPVLPEFIAYQPPPDR